ncbi:beta-2-microglobulin [Anas acuta]|uniref:beta-2-microglobulin n=1 Tax=Anas acuta TaxID=28680 RepID=UPI0035C8C8B6
MGLAAKAAIVALVALVALLGQGQAKAAPKVQVYSRHPATAGTENILNCYVEGFHPPKIDIALLKNGEPMKDVKYNDMSFGDDWTFQRLVYAPFTPTKSDVYTCRVNHEAFAEPQSFRWEPDF